MACKTIASLVATAGVTDLTGSTPTKESLYDLSTNVLKNALRFTGKLGVIAAESDDQPLLVEEAWNSKYLAVFDPLDGALNIDVGIVTGTIFGIFKEQEECLMDFGEEVGSEGKKRLLKTLLPENIVAAGYCMYSSCTVMMFSMGEGE
jgi:fructose-1,6-bisphosphatase I